jgi:hypothetical protein
MLALCERTDGVRECLVCRDTFTAGEYAGRVEQVLHELQAA